MRGSFWLSDEQWAAIAASSLLRGGEVKEGDDSQGSGYQSAMMLSNLAAALSEENRLCRRGADSSVVG